MQTQSDGTLTTSLTGTRAFKSHTTEVAVRVRPLSHEEVSKGFQSCVNVVNNSVLLADKQFDFDAAFPVTTQQENIYTTLVQPLIDEFFDGYNVTVLAYGQTGSGKTYTMGNDFASSVSPTDSGIIPRVIDSIFERVNALVRPQHFVVLGGFEQEVIDLLVNRFLVLVEYYRQVRDCLYVAMEIVELLSLDLVSTW